MFTTVSFSPPESHNFIASRAGETTHRSEPHRVKAKGVLTLEEELQGKNFKS